MSRSPLTIRGVVRRDFMAGLLGSTAAAFVLACRPGTNAQQAAAGMGQESSPAEVGASEITATPRRGGRFSQAIPGTFRQHDAHTALGLSLWHVISERAIDVHPATGRLIPNLIDRWEVVDPQGLELILRLKDGVRMPDRSPVHGRKFDAHDLAFNLTRAAGRTADVERIPVAAFQRASLLANLVAAEVVDERTVRVRLSAPNSAFLNGLADGRMLMMPREIASLGFSDPTKLVGPGPFQVAEWRVDSGIRFTRFDDYFRRDEPYFDEFNAIVIPDAAAQEAAFVSNQTQLMPALPASQSDRVLNARRDARLYEWMDTSWQHLRPSLRHRDFRDARVRRALSLLIDRTALGDAAYGSGWAYQAALNPGFPEAWSAERVRALPGFNPLTKERDRQDAAELLRAAGYDRGKGLDFGITFPAANEPARENATRLHGQFLAALPAAVVKLQSAPDSASFATQQASGAFDTAAYVSTAAPDAVLELRAHYRTKGSRNYGGFSDPDCDALLDKALAAVDFDARGEILDQFQGRFVSDWTPMFVLYAQPARNLLAGNVGGYEATVGPWYGFGSASRGGRWHYVS